MACRIRSFLPEPVRGTVAPLDQATIFALMRLIGGSAPPELAEVSNDMSHKDLVSEQRRVTFICCRPSWRRLRRRHIRI